MEYIYQHGPKSSIDKYLKVSFSIHFAILVLIFLLAQIKHIVSDETEKFNLQLIESSVRVDMVSMPKFTLKELKTISMDEVGNGQEEAIQDHATKQETTAIPDNEPVFEKEKKTKSFQEIMQELKAKDHKLEKANIKKPVAERETHKQLLNDRLKGKLRGLVLAGNKLSQGTSVQGDASDIAKGAYYDYLLKLPDWVRPHWSLPSFLREQQLKCRVRIFLASSGEIIKAVLFESSGNTEYDERALAAVKHASPFPAPAPEFSRKVSEGEIILGFPL